MVMNMDEENIKSIDILSVDDRLVAGWASVEIVDRQGQIVPIDELNSALIRYSIRGAPLNYGHKNHQVGRVINWYIIKHPETGKWGVYIIAYVFKGEPIYDIVWEAIKEGKLTGFSIAGIAGETVRDMVKDVDGLMKSAEILKKITITEISIVEKPANPLAVIEQVNKFAKSMNDDIANIMTSSYVNGLLDNTYEILKFNLGEEVASRVLPVIEDVLKTILKGIVVTDEFSKNVKSRGEKVIALFENEADAFNYAISRSGYVVPSTNGMFAVIIPDDTMAITADDKVNAEVFELGGEAKVEGVEDIMLVKEEGVLSTDSDEAYENPTYGGENSGEVKNARRKRKNAEISKAIKSKRELLKILRRIYIRAKRIRGFVNNHTDAGAYKGMADDVLRMLGTLIDEVKHGEIDISKGDEKEDNVKKKINAVLEAFGKDGILDVVLLNKLRQGMIDELEAVKRYEMMAEQFRETGYDVAAEKLMKIIEDEKRHIGEFLAIIEELSPGDAELMSEGYNEQMGENSPDEVVEENTEVIIPGEIINSVAKGRGEHTRCMERYYNFKENHFKGRAGTGERFENCVKAQMECNGKSEEEARRICAAIAHRKGIVSHKKGISSGVKKKLDKVLNEIKKAKEKKISNCLNRYKDKNGKFKEMTCPDNPKEKSRFCGCVRAQMECNGKSLQEAKKICGYIKNYVKKGEEIQMKILKAKLNILEKEVKRKNREKKKEGPGRPKDKCRQKYVDSSGKYKKMSDPRHPKKPISEFWGCVRYAMECKRMSYNDAKNWCGKARYEALTGVGERTSLSTKK